MYPMILVSRFLWNYMIRTKHLKHWRYWKIFLSLNQLCFVDPMHELWYGILGPNILFPSPHDPNESFSTSREQTTMGLMDGYDLSTINFSNILDIDNMVYHNAWVKVLEVYILVPYGDVIHHAGVILVYDEHIWVIIIVGVILACKGLTTSVVPKCTNNNKLVTYWFYTMYFVFCISIQNEISLGTIYVWI